MCYMKQDMYDFSQITLHVSPKLLLLIFGYIILCYKCCICINLNQSGPLTKSKLKRQIFDTFKVYFIQVPNQFNRIRYFEIIIYRICL